MRIEALLDTNVILASLDFDHEHHGPSSALLRTSGPDRFAVPAHTLAEAYSTLTRGGGSGPFNWSPAEAVAALDNIRSITVLLGLTAAQTFDAVRDYASAGGVGPRLCDKLIGQVAVAHGIKAIVSWNVRHMRGLFPELDVRTPSEWSAAKPS